MRDKKKCSDHIINVRKQFNIVAVLVCLFGLNQVHAQIVGPYTGIDHATSFTNPAAGGACGSIAAINAAIGDADFINGTAEIPLGWSFSGTWASGSTYYDGPGSEILLVSLHTYTESWNVALRLSDGTTTAFQPYDLTIVTTDATGSLTTCGGVVFGFTYERPSQELDFASYVIPPGEGVIGIVFEPYSDGAGNPDVHGVMVLEGTPVDGGCEDLIVEVSDSIVCIGEEITLDATSIGGGTITWDGGVINGIPFIPALGTTTYTATSDDAGDCEFSIDIIVNDLSAVVAGVDDEEICFGESVTFNGSGALSYSWDMGVTDGVVFTPPALGTETYVVTGTDANGCVNTDSIAVTVLDSPTVTANVDDTEICEGESVIFTSTGTADTYTWDLGVVEGVPYTPMGVGTTTYTVVGALAGGCTFSASVDVTVNPTPTVTAASSSSEICLGESVTLTGGGAATYTWDLGVANGIPFTIGSVGTYTYTVTGTSAAGCTNTASVSVSVVDCEPIFAGFLMDNGVCRGNCITLTDTSSGGTIVSWEWDFGGAATPGTSTESSPTICLNTPGIYTILLTITSPFGETSTASKTLTVYDLPVLYTEMDTIIDAGGNANLIATSLSAGTYTWEPDYNIDCAECGITSASPIDSTLYSVYFIDENGCAAEGNVLVLVNFIEGVGVPTAFSPNGDGINDVLFVRGFGLAAISLVVYNRYGEVVFETTNQNIGWDGTFKNREENPGVFTWVLQYDFVTGKKGMQKGNTTLIR